MCDLRGHDVVLKQILYSTSVVVDDYFDTNSITKVAKALISMRRCSVYRNHPVGPLIPVVVMSLLYRQLIAVITWN